MRIAVAGGTGVVGRHVVAEAERRGHDVVVLTRSSGVDLTTGDGLAGKLDGVDAVVDTTSVQTTSAKVAKAFFGDVTRHLLAAEQAAGVGHHVVLSIVGIDGVPYGYYQAKAAQEEQVAADSVPWTVLRATQFHEFAEQVLGFINIGPISLVPGMLSQPIAAAEVGHHLIDLVEAGPAGRVPDLGGPERLDMVDLAKRVNETKQLGRKVFGLRVPGAAGRDMRSGKLCTDSDGPRGTQKFTDWLNNSR